MRKTLVLFSLILLICAVLAQNSPRTMPVHLSAAAIAAFQKIDAERIRAHVRFLSHDLLEGRGTGQRGGDIAAEYIATQFALDGLKPAGDQRHLHAESSHGRHHAGAGDHIFPGSGQRPARGAEATRPIRRP